MKRWALVLVVVGGCAGRLHEYGEEYQEFYGSPSAETQSENVERKKIMHWRKDPKLKVRVGFLEKYRVRLKGMRDWRELYYILNPGGTDRLGFINEDGKFFRYDRDGRAVKVGEYAVIDTGVKVFFGFPLSDNLGFEDLDPYKD